jgi:hypothetical protein
LTIANNGCHLLPRLSPSLQHKKAYVTIRCSLILSGAALPTNFVSRLWSGGTTSLISGLAEDRKVLNGHGTPVTIRTSFTDPIKIGVRILDFLPAPRRSESLAAVLECRLAERSKRTNPCVCRCLRRSYYAYNLHLGALTPCGGNWLQRVHL